MIEVALKAVCFAGLFGSGFFLGKIHECWLRERNARRFDERNKIASRMWLRLRAY